jgi:cholesterol oxidase
MDLTQGRFNLFVIEDQGPTQNPARKQMLYHLNFRSPDGKLYLLDGAKQVHENPNTDMWVDLTTLFTKVYRIDGQQQTLVGSGVLHIHLLDFMQQLTTFRVHDAGSPAASMQALNRFGQFFMGQVWDVYERHVMDYAPF